MFINEFIEKNGYNKSSCCTKYNGYIKHLDYNINDFFYMHVKPDLSFMFGYNLDNGLVLKTGWNYSLEDKKLYNNVYKTFITTIEKISI